MPAFTVSPQIRRILHCTLIYPLELYPAFFGYYFFNVMMAVLQMLHIFWAYFILRMAHKFITGKVRKAPPPFCGSHYSLFFLSRQGFSV